MNAYELAEKLNDAVNKNEKHLTLDIEAMLMLRQQADRIAELEKDLALKTRDRDVFRDFTLAYEKRIEELEKLEQDFIRVIKQTNPNKPQTKPLSDEEIWDLFQKTQHNAMDFARAILRKAQEK